MDQLTTQIRIFENAIQPAVRAYVRSEELRIGEGDTVSEAGPLKRHAQELASSAGRAMQQIRDLDPAQATRLTGLWRQYGSERGIDEEFFWAAALGQAPDPQGE